MVNTNYMCGDSVVAFLVCIARKRYVKFWKMVTMGNLLVYYADDFFQRNFRASHREREGARTLVFPFHLYLRVEHFSIFGLFVNSMQFYI